MTPAAQRSAAHALLFTFTLLLVRKLDHGFSGSWWVVFSPLWLFHALVAQGIRFSIPAPLDVYSCQWPPFHAIVATPLLVAFELLLCIHLDNSSAVNLKIVFLPVVLLEIIIIIDNCRMCFSIMQEEARDPSTVDFTWGKMTHCLIILAMAFYLGATIFMVLMLTVNHTINTRNWWGPSLVFSVGHCFAFSVCTKWTSPVINGHPQIRVCSSSSSSSSSSSRSVDYLKHDNQKPTRLCSLQASGGHFMMVMIMVFHVLLCMYLEGTHVRAREIPLGVIFSPLLLLQGVGVVFSTLQLMERIAIVHLNIEPSNARWYFMFSSRAYEFLEFMLHGSRFLGWWSFLEGIRKPDKEVLYDGESRWYNFSETPPDALKNISRRDLLEEVWMLQVALHKEIKAIENIAKQKGTHVRAREIPLGVIFSPLLLLQGVGVVFSTLQLMERIAIVHLNIEPSNARWYFMFSSRAYEFLEFMLHGSRFLGWWSFLEGIRKPNKEVLYDGESRWYNFSETPRDALKNMSRRDLLEEVWMLQVALHKEIKAIESTAKQKVMCKICCEKEIDVVLFPCTHWYICRSCSNNFSKCPRCGVYIEEAMLVYDS